MLLWEPSSMCVWGWQLGPWHHSHVSPAVIDSLSAHEILHPNLVETVSLNFLVSWCHAGVGCLCSHTKQPCPFFLNLSFPTWISRRAILTSSPKWVNLIHPPSYGDKIRALCLGFVPGSWRRAPENPCNFLGRRGERSTAVTRDQPPVAAPEFMPVKRLLEDEAGG